MNIELGKLKQALEEATKACDDPVGIVEFRVEESAGVSEPYSRTITVKYWVQS